MDKKLVATKDETLRPYQYTAKRCIWEAWQQADSVMLQMPTGTGKTRLFVSLIADLQRVCREVRVLIVTHRKELVEQISHSLTNHYGLEHGICSGSRRKEVERPVMVCSVQAFARGVQRKGKGEGVADYLKQAFDYIIIDEAHHALAPSYRLLWDFYPKAKKLGVTATPYRLKRGSFMELFEKLIVSYAISGYIEQGYLADYELYTASARKAALQKTNRLTRFGADGDYRIKDLDKIYNVSEEIAFLYDCYKKYADGRKGIVYAVNRDHAARIALYFEAQGVQAASIDSHTPACERERLLDEFKEGKVRVLVNVELFTEGFDCPSVEFVMTARPTRSLSLYLQQVGRALRPFADGCKKVCILDVVGLYARFGLPERKRDWPAHFLGEIPQGERYNRPLGDTNTMSSLLVHKERRGRASLPVKL